MDMTDPGRGARWDATWRMVLRQEANVSAAVSLLVLVAWVLSGGSFWPRWVWFGLAVPLALQAGIRRGLRAPRGQRLLAVHGAVSVVLALTALAIWVLTGASRAFWPAWPTLGLGIALALHHSGGLPGPSAGEAGSPHPGYLHVGRVVVFLAAVAVLAVIGPPVIVMAPGLAGPVRIG